MNSKPWWTAALSAAAISLNADGIGDTTSAALDRRRRAPRGQLRLPCSFKGIGFAGSSRIARRVSAP